jgi:F0F1-type ATP synthase assembly protein I
MARIVQISLLAVDRMSRPLRAAAENTDQLANHMERLNKVSRAGGLAVAAGGATALAGAMAPAVAAVAAMPAAMAAAKVASATLKVGMVGLGEAMGAVAEGDAEALNEALKKLSPNARAFVKEAASMKAEVKGLQQAVQDRLFAGMAADLDRVGKNLLPTAETGMTQVAGALNSVGREAMRVAGTAWFKGEVTKVFAGTTGIVKTLHGAVEPLMRSVLTLANAGMPLAQRMASWAVNGLKAGAAFLRAKEGSGALSATITRIGDGFEAAGRIGRNLAMTLANIVGQADAFGLSGAGMLSTLEQLTAKMLTWSQSAQGQGQSAAVFATLGEAAGNLMAVLPLLSGALGVVATILTSIPGPLQGVVSSAISWGLVISILVTRLKLLTVATAAYKAVVAGSQFVGGLRNVAAAQADGATKATRLGAALRTQAAAARAAAAAQLASARAATASALASARARAATIAQAVAQRVAAVAARVWAAAQWLLNAAMSANPIALIVIAIVGLVAAVVLAYKRFTWFRAVVDAVWGGIKTAIAAAWAAVKPVFETLKRYVSVVLVAAFKAYWAYLKFVWGAVSAVIKVAWNGVIKPIFNLVKWYIVNVVIAYFKLLWSAVKLAWAGIKVVISAAWNNGIRPTFDRLRAGISAVRSAFSTAVSAIKTIWDKLKNIAKVPVNFIISTVYNNGIRGLVNKIAEFAGLPLRLKEIPKLARGGTLANPATAAPMVTSGAMAIVGEGRRAHPEYVIPTDPAHRKRAQALWAAAGQDLAGGRPDRRRLGGEGMFFERGGIIGRFLGGLRNFSFLDPTKAFRSALGRLAGGIPGTGVFRDAVAGLPAKFVTWLVDWFKSKVGLGGGGPGVQRALAFAKAQDGKPYGWGAVGPGAYDCSGLWSAIVNVIKGRNPYSRLFSTFGFTGASAGPEGFRRGLNAAVRVGVTNAGVGHMAGTIGRTNIESSGGAGVRFGGGARGFNDPLFPMQYGLRADTGALALAPGWNPPTFNGTGRMEYLETPRRGGETRYEITVNVAPGGNLAEAGRQVVQAIREYERRSGRGWRT